MRTSTNNFIYDRTENLIASRIPTLFFKVFVHILFVLQSFTKKLVDIGYFDYILVFTLLVILILEFWHKNH